jgi:hypothetical protein
VPQLEGAIGAVESVGSKFVSGHSLISTISAPLVASTEGSTDGSGGSSLSSR